MVIRFGRTSYVSRWYVVNRFDTRLKDQASGVNWEFPQFLLELLPPLPLPVSQNNMVPSLKRHACRFSTCKRTFQSTTDRQRHERTHNSTKYYTCEKCGSGFNQQGQLNTHMNTHTGEKPHECPKCPKAFADPGSRSRHIKRIHGGTFYKCPKLKRRHDFVGHLKNAHHMGMKDLSPAERKPVELSGTDAKAKGERVQSSAYEDDDIAWDESASSATHTPDSFVSDLSMDQAFVRPPYIPVYKYYYSDGQFRHAYPQPSLQVPPIYGHASGSHISHSFYDNQGGVYSPQTHPYGDNSLLAPSSYIAQDTSKLQILANAASMMHGGQSSWVIDPSLD
ncbi:hypothetical protein M422DRAFT_238931 [Sphaerobolus stellatus SS14]|nr:hypothetical protein M422DRAFT_238931 [Sphaerobolus stellatus SS14]